MTYQKQLQPDGLKYNKEQELIQFYPQITVLKI